MNDITEDNQEKASLLERGLGELKELIVTIAVFLPVWFFVSLFFYELRSIPSESMVPNL